MAGEGGAGVGTIVGVGLVLLATVVIGAFVARMVGEPPSTTTESHAPPPPVERPPAIPAITASTPRPPLAFNDPDNAARFTHAQATVDALAVTVGAVTAAKDDTAATDAKAACSKADQEMVPLVAEPHPTVKDLVAKEHRLCEYQRPLAALDAMVTRIRAARKKSGARPDALCKAAEAIAIEIQGGHYQDDPTMLASLDEVGKLCI